MGRKRIGILTGGGDCPGLNCAIAAVVSHATLTYGWEVLGIPYATRGLQEGRSVPLDLRSLSVHGIYPLVGMGGTILGSVNKGDTLTHAEEILAGYRALQLDALIAIGGDGSLAIMHHLAGLGNWNLVTIPKTIDNDVALTERAIGFDSAANTITEALNRLIFTAASHDRVMVVEVMGRSVGHLALHSGIAGGADIILIPEIPYSIAAICQQIERLHSERGRKYAIAVVAEGVCTESGQPSFYTDPEGKPHFRGIGQYIAEEVARRTKKPLDTRVTVLGHVQRGGLPSALDRIVAASLGKVAVDSIAIENFGQMVAWRNGMPQCVPLQDAIARSPLPVDLDSYLVQTARSLGIYLGEMPEA